MLLGVVNAVDPSWSKVRQCLSRLSIIKCQLKGKYLFNLLLFSSEPPSFITMPESQAAVPNAKVRFKGTFKGTPPFTVKWFKDDTELMTGPTCFTGLDGLSCFLELFSVGVAQSGVYSCQVSNDAGSVRCSADLTVKGWIEIF